jgi:hypothetical protein
MKNLCVILAAFAAGTAPVLSTVAPAPIEITQPKEANQRSGFEAVSSIRKSFERGQYDPFLKEMDDSYVAVKENGQIEQLMETRNGDPALWQEWESRALLLQNEKSKELLDAVSGESASPFVEKVRSAASGLVTQPNQDAISKMANYRIMAPGTGKNGDENRLIDLDLEYEYKALHLDLPGASLAERREKHCALKMEKLDKMVAAASSFEDAALKEEVALYAQNFDQRLAQSWDIADLNGLANGAQKPASGLEEKVASILHTYQDKFSDMSRQFIAEHDKN